MNARLTNPIELLPDLQKPFFQLNKTLHATGVPEATMELAHLRVSQINGCGVCVYGGVDAAKKHGETDERLHSVAIWRESPLFTAAERAVLALAEAATRIADRPESVTDEVWAGLAEHFDEKQQAAIVTYVSLVNLINRVNAVTRQQAGVTWA